MGQGFSRMLQMINMDLLKNAEKINDDLSLKFEENQNNKSNYENKIMPRLNSSKDIRKIKAKHNNSDNIFYFNFLKNEINNDINRSNISNVLDTNKIYNYNSSGNNSNNSIDNINDNSKIFKKVYKNQSPIDKNLQTFTKINLKNKNI